MKNNPSKTTKNPHLDFFQMVWEVVRLIPPGRVTSYGAIARYLGTGASARVVGYAMNASHQCTPKVPAHRVVNRLGIMTGKHHFENPFQMQEKLEKEGILVQQDKVVEFDRLFWDPSAELAL